MYICINQYQTDQKNPYFRSKNKRNNKEVNLLDEDNKFNQHTFICLTDKDKRATDTSVIFK